MNVSGLGGGNQNMENVANTKSTNHPTKWISLVVTLVILIIIVAGVAVMSMKSDNHRMPSKNLGGPKTQLVQPSSTNAPITDQPSVLPDVSKLPRN